MGQRVQLPKDPNVRNAVKLFLNPQTGPKSSIIIYEKEIFQIKIYFSV